MLKKLPIEFINALINNHNLYSTRDIIVSYNYWSIIIDLFDQNIHQNQRYPFYKTTLNVCLSQAFSLVQVQWLNAPVVEVFPPLSQPLEHSTTALAQLEKTCDAW